MCMQMSQLITHQIISTFMRLFDFHCGQFTFYIEIIHQKKKKW